MQIIALDPSRPEQDFPNLDKALRDPNGLLAIGGCLSQIRLINAYRQGIFPWYNPDEPILWWSPNPRLVLFPDKLIISRSLKKTLRRNTFTVTFDQAFQEVITACASLREEKTGTWITKEINLAYTDLHKAGYAHSVETWLNGQLVGGLYGVALGQVFFGESMFHRTTDASKVAFVHLVEQLKRWEYQLIDCQVHTSHLSSFGAINFARNEFKNLLNKYCELPANPLAWHPI